MPWEASGAPIQGRDWSVKETSLCMLLIVAVKTKGMGLSGKQMNKTGKIIIKTEILAGGNGAIDC